MRSERSRKRHWQTVALMFATVTVAAQATASTVDVVRWPSGTNYADQVNLTTGAWNHTGDVEAPLRTGHEVKDWVKWGNYPAWSGGVYNDNMLDAANGGDYRNGGSGQISHVLSKVVVGTAFTARQNNNLFHHAWTDGTLTSSVADMVGGVACKLDEGGIRDRDGSGLQLTVSNLIAGTPYRLHLLAGGRHATTTVTAALTDGATDNDVFLNATGSWDEDNYLIDFTPTAVGQTLTVSVTGVMEYDPGASVFWGDVIMSAAVLSSPVPEPATAALLAVGGSLLALRRRR